MTEELVARYREILKKARRKIDLGQREAFLSLTIRELEIELEEGKANYRQLMQDGELPFPQDAHEYHDSLSQTIERLKLERDKVRAGAASPTPEPEVEPYLSSPIAVPNSLDNSPSGDALADKKYLDTNEAVRYTGIPKSSIYKMTSLHEIPFSKPKGRLIFKRTAIDEWLEKHGRRVL